MCACVGCAGAGGGVDGGGGVGGGGGGGESASIEHAVARSQARLIGTGHGFPRDLVVGLTVISPSRATDAGVSAERLPARYIVWPDGTLGADFLPAARSVTRVREAAAISVPVRAALAPERLERVWRVVAGALVEGAASADPAAARLVVGAMSTAAGAAVDDSGAPDPRRLTYVLEVGAGGARQRVVLAEPLPGVDESALRRAAAGLARELAAWSYLSPGPAVYGSGR